MTWGKSSFSCLAQVKVKDLKGLRRILQPVGFSSQCNFHSEQPPYNRASLPLEELLAAFHSLKIPPPPGGRKETHVLPLKPWGHSEKSRLLESQIGKGPWEGPTWAHFRGKEAPFRESPRATGVHLGQSDKSPGIFLKILTPGSDHRPTESESAGRGRDPVILMCVHVQKKQWFEWKAFISEMTIVRFRKMNSLLGIPKWPVSRASTWNV